jgi:protein gp37
MGDTTKIQWTDHTFNPWIGCTKVHAGCTNCYAEVQNARWGYNGALPGRGSGTWGNGAPRHVTADANWKKPLQWARAAAKAGKRARVFCASLADVLDEEAPIAAQYRLWDTIRSTADRCGHGIPRWLCELSINDVGGCSSIGGGLDWQILTKRPERWELIPADIRPLVWLGTSISDQKTANEWIPRLLKAQGFRLRFLSIEPMVGPVVLPRICACGCGLEERAAVREAMNTPAALNRDQAEAGIKTTLGVDWVVVGGESGHGARPFDVQWARSIVEQCNTAGVPCFVKQLGARPLAGEVKRAGQMVPFVMRTADKKGGDPSEWPADLRVRQFPEVRS